MATATYEGYCIHVWQQSSKTRPTEPLSVQVWLQAWCFNLSCRAHGLLGLWRARVHAHAIAPYSSYELSHVAPQCPMFYQLVQADSPTSAACSPIASACDDVQYKVYTVQCKITSLVLPSEQLTSITSGAHGLLITHTHTTKILWWLCKYSALYPRQQS